MDFFNKDKELNDHIKQDYEQVDIEAQTRIPQYKKLMEFCKESIDSYEHCLQKNITSLNPSSCLKEETIKSKCVDEYACPKEFNEYMSCIKKDRTKCRLFKLELLNCQQQLWEQVDKVTKDVWKERRMDKDWDLPKTK